MVNSEKRTLSQLSRDYIALEKELKETNTDLRKIISNLKNCSNIINSNFIIDNNGVDKGKILEIVNSLNKNQNTINNIILPNITYIKNDLNSRITQLYQEGK